MFKALKADWHTKGEKEEILFLMIKASYSFKRVLNNYLDKIQGTTGNMYTISGQLINKMNGVNTPLHSHASVHTHVYR